MRQPPDRRRGRPGSRQTGPHVDSPPSVTDIATVTRSPRRTAHVSLFAPTGRRRWWWYSYRCPACRSYQFGRARELDRVTGNRRAGCGHEVEIVIARTYRSPEAP